MTRNVEQGAALAHRGKGTLTLWNPWNEMTDLRRRMDELFSRSFGYTPLSRLIPGDGEDLEPAVDIYETDDNVLAFAAVPGFTLKDLHLEAAPETIMISGERKAFYEDEKAVTHRANGVSGSISFHSLYTLPSEIDPNKVKATFDRGILRLEMPKTERARAKSVKVNVTAA